MLLVDTAGIRRQSKVSESVEYYTTLRSQRAAERADVALVVCDAQDGITAQDLRIAELAMKSGCATALVLNKWDITGGEDERSGRRRRRRRGARPRARAREPQAAPAAEGADRVARRPAATCSGCCRRRSRSAERAGHRIPTPELNRFLGEITAARQPPAKQGHRLKMLYIAQIGERPPRFAIQVNSRTRVTREYAYFVENRLRDRYALEGIPLIIDFPERKQRER